MNTALATAKWQIQDRSRPDWIEHYQQSRNLPSRDAVLGVLETLEPFHSLLELGCHAGPMLDRVRERFPSVALFGVEANAKAAAACPFQCRNMDLMEYLPTQPRNAADIILTHYTLAYISLRDLPGVLAQCVRIAGKAIVLAEPTGPERLVYDYPEWRHDYPGLLRSLGLKVTEQIIDGPGHMNAITVATR